MKKIDRTVPVSRDDYDAMVDQRDRFRAALVQAETYLSGRGSYVASAREELVDVKHIDHPTDLEEAVLHLDAALTQARDCALAGLDLVKKALKPRSA